MAKKPIESSKPLEYVRTSLWFLGVILAIVGIVVAPKQILGEEQLYSSAVSMADTKEESFAMIDYKVYGTEARMEAGLEAELPARITQAKANNDILVVKIPSENFYTETFNDYILVHSQQVPELNLEFCVAKNVNVLGATMPTRTFINLARDLLNKATILYLILISLIAFFIAVPCGIAGTKSLLRLIRLYKGGPAKTVQKEGNQ